MAQTQPETLKSELRSLLRRTLECENTADMEQLFQSIVDTGNNLRQRYGLGAKVETLHSVSDMKTPTEQMQAAGIGSESVMGHAVFLRARGPPQDPCLFDQCFTTPEAATQVRNFAFQQADRLLPHAGPMLVYPPLLLRAQKDECVLLNVDTTGRVQRAAGGATANGLLVLCANGPIVPVIARKDHTNYRSLVQSIYGLMGNSNAAVLEKTLSVH